MNLVRLIEDIHKEYVYIQCEREQIHQLNLDLLEEIESLFNVTWITRNQRYLCDKLNINGKEYFELINELNKIEDIIFHKGHKKFGSNEVFLSQLLQYLRTNPKSVSYLLFYAEKSDCSGFLDPLCKIVISSVYSHCYLDQDKTAIVDLMEELLEIYINFYKDVRRQIHSKHSSFCIIYRHFCDELPELKTFYKLAFYQPIMQVLSEDSFYLDVDSNRAVMRFPPKDKEKYFGKEGTEEYTNNLVKYQKWSQQKLKFFISNFINSLKSNIFAFPQSLATLIIRLYSKLIEHLEFKKVHAACIDLIFCFLICPAIQNPDLFGITDLHVNQISQYNLLQCAEIIQLLALYKWEKVSSTYQGVCDLFDKDCLSFVIDHILGIFNNFSLPKTIEMTTLPYFLISEFELKLFLEYIRVFLADSEQNDNPLKTYFNKLPESVFNFEIVYKFSSLTRKTKAVEKFGDQQSEVDIRKIIFSKNEEFISCYKLLFVSRNILKIMNEDISSIKMTGMLKEKDFINKIKGKQFNVEDFDSLMNEVNNICAEERFEHVTDSKSMSGKFNENVSCIPGTVEGDIKNLVDFSLNNDYLNCFESHQMDSPFKDNLPLNADTLLDLKDFSEIQTLEMLTLDYKESEQVVNLNVVDEFIKLEKDSAANDADPNLQPLIDIDTTDSQTVVKVVEERQEEPNTLENVQRYQRTNSKKGFFSLSNLKNIKDKVKNISIKDGKIRHTNLDTFDQLNPSNESKILPNVSKERFNIANVKEKTQEILEKYKSNKVSEEELISTTETNAPVSSLIDIGDEVDHDSVNQIGDPYGHIKNKLRKLMCLINISSTFQNYRFLNINNKSNFVMLLKILLSQARNMNEISNTVLLIDMIRVMESLSENDFVNTFKEIETDMRTRNLMIIYLQKSRQYLLFRLQAIKSTQMTLNKEQYITNFIIVSFLVRHLMENNESRIQQLAAKVGDVSMLSDEKVSLMERLLHEIANSVECNCLTDNQHSLAKQTIERHLLGKIYLEVFYANGDIDKMRDQILHQQIGHLSKTITPSSKLLRIPSKYHATAPWPSAQAELLLLSAYKTARDKVQCIHRCCSHIITLLSTSDNSIPSADDLLPVLIFVAIQANPMSILSTIQYVNSFYSKDMIGEEAYYWTQWCSVIEFIKTILN